MTRSRTRPACAGIVLAAAARLGPRPATTRESDEHSFRRASRYLRALGQDRAVGFLHPLVLHLLDVAACADALLGREPATTRDRFGGILGLAWPEARPWLLLIIACHDLGKACPGFQLKWGDIRAQLATARLSIREYPTPPSTTAFVSQIALSQLLQERGWAQGASDLLGDAVGCTTVPDAVPSPLTNLPTTEMRLATMTGHKPGGIVRLT